MTSKSHITQPNPKNHEVITVLETDTQLRVIKSDNTVKIHKELILK